MGTSLTFRPAFLHRTMISIWNTYPRDFTRDTTSSMASLRYRRNEPVRSLTPGASNTCAR